MTDKHKKSISKFLSLILRHKPQEIDLSLDENGWVNVAELVAKSKVKQIIFSFDDLLEIVSTNDKQRFIFNDDQTKIRANQGHSIEIDLALTVVSHLIFCTMEQQELT
ncbi:MAG: RNA 2'-phosphotransferase [Ferruginibacter sp.]